MPEHTTQPFARTWLYSPDCPEGRIFESADSAAAAEKDGWVDSPAKLTAKKVRPGAGGKKAAGDDDSQ